MSNTKVEKGLAEEPSVYVVSSSTGPQELNELGKWYGQVKLFQQVFKFRNGLHKDWDTDGWEDGEKLKKEKCGINQWGDRELLVNITGNQMVGPYCFSSCEECS